MNRLPIDVANDHTASFVEANVPRGSRIIEVGCGDGHLAALLARRGYDVTGIDIDDRGIANARQRGVRTICASWPDVDVPPTDAVIFARSLHHIGSLSAAIRKARDVLPAGGVVLIEDFAFDKANRSTVDWLVGTIRTLRARKQITKTQGHFAEVLLDADDAYSAWHRNHDHDLHTIAAMSAAIAESFTVHCENRIPYLYRYLVESLPNTANAAALLAGILAEEMRRGQSGEIRLIGRRVVGIVK